MNIENIYELFLYDEEDFIRNAYLNLLRREPDNNGVEYYQGRMSMRHGKNRVIYQLSQSVECRTYKEIKGLEEFLNEEEKCNKWLWKVIGFHRYRLRKKIQYNVNRILMERLKNISLSETENTKHSVHHDAEKVLSNIKENSLIIIDQKVERSSYSSIDQFLSKEHRICIDKHNFENLSEVFSDELFLRFMYLWLLGRPIDPEAFDIYSKVLKKDNGRLKFAETIISSDEFKKHESSNKVADLDQENFPFGSKVLSLVEDLLKL